MNLNSAAINHALNRRLGEPPEEDHDPVCQWLASHAVARRRTVLVGIDPRIAFSLVAPTSGIVVAVGDFDYPESNQDAVDNLCSTTRRCAAAILLRQFRLKIGKLHTIPDSELADQFDMFVLNQPYESADEAARDIQRGISLCQPAALICGTCYSNPATKEAVDKLLPFRQLFGNIWFGYL